MKHPKTNFCGAACARFALTPYPSPQLGEGRISELGVVQALYACTTPHSQSYPPYLGEGGIGGMGI